MGLQRFLLFSTLIFSCVVSFAGRPTDTSQFVTGPLRFCLEGLGYHPAQQSGVFVFSHMNQRTGKANPLEHGFIQVTRTTLLDVRPIPGAKVSIEALPQETDATAEQTYFDLDKLLIVNQSVLAVTNAQGATENIFLRKSFCGRVIPTSVDSALAAIGRVVINDHASLNSAQREAEVRSKKIKLLREQNNLSYSPQSTNALIHGIQSRLHLQQINLKFCEEIPQPDIVQAALNHSHVLAAISDSFKADLQNQPELLLSELAPSNAGF